MFNLTESQKALLRAFVGAIRKKDLPEEFNVIFGADQTFIHYAGAKGFVPAVDITAPKLEALAKEELITCRNVKDEFFKHVAITQRGYEAVDADFRRPRHVSALESSPEERTLVALWRAATRQERLGIAGVFSSVFIFGYLAAKVSFFSRLIDLIRDIIP